MSLGDEFGPIEAAALRSPAIREALAVLAALIEVIEREGAGAAAALLDASVPRLAPSLAAAVRDAFATGVAEAMTIAGGMRPETSIGVRRLRELDAILRDDLARAAALAAAGSEADVIAAPLQAAAVSIERWVRTEVVAAGNAGAREVAALNGLPLVWVAETDACVRCLAYSGLVVDSGAKWPGGLTYGRRTPSVAAQGAVRHPPLHPRCRCHVEPLGSQEYADALRREADRSVLRGFSLQSEPMSVRIDAARRLLAAGVDAPASVIAYAQRAVRAGTFATRGRP